MAKKIGELVIALLVLSFIITSFSLFINEADSKLSVDSGVVSSSFTSLNSSLSGVKGLESDFVSKVDNSSSLEPTENTDVETQGDDAGGILNLLSKNILTGFFKEVAVRIPGSSLIIGFLASLMAVIVTVLLLRFFRGETKI